MLHQRNYQHIIQVMIQFYMIYLNLVHKNKHHSIILINKNIFS